MEIGLIYSKADPRQTDARDFVIRFLSDHGVLAQVTEEDQPVPSPTLIIDGFTLTEQRQRTRTTESHSMFPGLDDIRQALEQQLWAV